MLVAKSREAVSPWSVRRAMSQAPEGAKAAAKEKTVKPTSPMMKTFIRPNKSAILPMAMRMAAAAST